MRLYRDPGYLPQGVARAAAIAEFDGMHLGHRALLEALEKNAGGREMLAVHCRPLESSVARLSSLRQELREIASAGVDRVLLARGRSARVREWVAIAPAIGVGALVFEENDIARPDGGAIELHALAPKRVDGEPISGERIRAAIGRHDFECAGRLLGRRYSIEGRVVHGFHRGATIGVPTANLLLRGVQLPPDGVYAVRARAREGWIDGVANIGTNPTFGNERRSVETHLLDFDGDLYGRRLEVAFVDRLRGERKFDGVEALVEQIRRDIGVARQILTAR